MRHFTQMFSCITGSWYSSIVIFILIYWILYVFFVHRFVYSLKCHWIGIWMGWKKNVYSSLIDWVNSELFCIRMYRKMLVYCTRKHTIQIQNIYSHERIIGPRREIKSSVHWLFVVASSLNRSNQLVEFNVRWIGIDCRKGFIYLLGTNCRISIKFIPY